MNTTGASSLTQFDALLEDVAVRLASRVAALLSAKPVDDLIDQTSAPGLTRSRYLYAARRGAFPSSRVGKRVIAKRSDVIGWIESKRQTPRASGPTLDLDAELAAMTRGRR